MTAKLYNSIVFQKLEKVTTSQGVTRKCTRDVLSCLTPGREFADLMRLAKSENFIASLRQRTPKDNSISPH